jgi:hypothetical protein
LGGGPPPGNVPPVRPRVLLLEGRSALASASTTVAPSAMPSTCTRVPPTSPTVTFVVVTLSPSSTLTVPFATADTGTVSTCDAVPVTIGAPRAR